MTGTRNKTCSSNGSKSNPCCWIQRDFLKEKLRVRERYWHSSSMTAILLKNEKQQQQQQSHRRRRRRRWIIPDGSAWRTYLPLIMYLIEQDDKSQDNSQDTSNGFC